MFQKTLFTVPLLLLFCPGCLLQKNRIRKPITRDVVQSIKPGSTMISEVSRILGAPNEIVWSNGVTTPMNSDQNIGITNTFTTKSEDLWVRAYHYRYTVKKTSGFTIIIFSILSYDTKYDEVVVFFDKSGKVTSIGSSLNSGQVSYNPFE